MMRKVTAALVALAALWLVPLAQTANGEGSNEKITLGPAGYDTPGQSRLVIAGTANVVVGPGDHVVICHAIGGANGTEFVQIAPSAGVVFGHDGHEGDRDIVPPFVYRDNQGDTVRTLEGGNNWTDAGRAIYENGCRVPQGSSQPPTGGCGTTCPGGPNPPHDECPNLEGVQTHVPTGYTRGTSGDCAPVGGSPCQCPQTTQTQQQQSVGSQTTQPQSTEAPRVPATAAGQSTVATTTAPATAAVKTSPAAKKTVKKAKVTKRKAKRAVKAIKRSVRKRPRALPFTP
jgi:hypothetical protein